MTTPDTPEGMSAGVVIVATAHATHPDNDDTPDVEEVQG